MDHSGTDQSVAANGTGGAGCSASRAAFEAKRKVALEALAAKCAALLPDPCSITLEIGSGHGHYLAAYSTAHPDEICVGIDLITKRVKKGQGKATRQGLGGLHFVKAEALEFLDALPDWVQLDRVFVLFPDPWPKKRHWKHRIVQQPLLDRLAGRMKPGASLCMRTDHEGYFEWMGEQVARNVHWKHEPSAEWPFEAPSFFQSLMDSWQSLVALRTLE